MPSVETAIVQAIKARVSTIDLSYEVFWTDEIVWENGKPKGLPVENKQPAPYIEAHHEPNQTVRRFIGSTDPHERPGLLLLTLCWPITKIGRGPGKQPADTIREFAASKLAGHFSADLPMDFEGVRTRVTKAPDVLGAYRDDAYLRTQVRILYHAFA